MKQKSFELLCASILGFGQLCIMTGYDSQSFILESVIHSIHEREPGRISPYAGYYGQAVLFAAYTLTCLFSPSILNISTSKFLLIVSAISFTSFPLGFLFVNPYYFYFSAFALGFGNSLYYLGMNSYLTSHSTRQTIETNVSVSWSVGCCCLIIGSAVMAGITKMTSGSNLGLGVESGLELTNLNSTVTSLHSHERKFNDMEIKLLFTAFSGISAIAIFAFSFLPSKSVDNCIENNEKTGGFWDELVLTCRTVVSPKMLQILPLSLLGGFNVSFWLSIFPTAMNFTKSNSNLIYIPAIWSLGAGIGEVFMGIAISFLSKRIKGFGLKPTMVIGGISVIAHCILIHLSTPFEAPMKPTSDEPLLFYHSYPLIFLIAVICGVSDCCINSVRSVICALVMPRRRAQSYAVARMYNAFACVICFFFSPIVPLYYYTYGLPVLAVFATVVFFRVANHTKVMERKMTIEHMENEKTKKEIIQIQTKETA